MSKSFEHIHYVVKPVSSDLTERGNDYPRKFGSELEADQFASQYENVIRSVESHTDNLACSVENCPGYLSYEDARVTIPCSGDCGNERHTNYHWNDANEPYICPACRLKSENDNRKRSKEVFDTDEIPHLWAHKVQSRARNKGGNLFFRDATIYSYRDSFPIASHVTGKAKDSAAILLTTERYSMTTGRHIDAVRHAIPPSVKVFHVAEPELHFVHGEYNSRGEYKQFKKSRVVTTHINNLKDYTARIQEQVEKAAKSNNKREDYLSAANALLKEMREYVEFFGIKVLNGKRVKLATIPADLTPLRKELQAKDRIANASRKERKRQQAERDAVYALETIQRWMVQHPEQALTWDGTLSQGQTIKLAFEVAEHKRIAAENHAKNVAALDEWMQAHPEQQAEWNGDYSRGCEIRRAFQVANRAKEWIAGEDIQSSYLYDIPTMLRIKGDMVETSRGASFPVTHARLGLALVKRVIQRGTEWHQNGEQCRLGHYRIDRITPDGTVFAGCHEVTWEAINRIASQLDAIESEAVNG